MAIKSVSVSVEGSGYDIVEGLAAFVRAVKAAGGFSVSAIPGEVAAAVADLVPLLADFEALPADAKEDLLSLIKGVNLGAYDIAAALLGK